jgi:hypothetical protein
MAYPEPIPRLSSRQTAEFHQRIEAFRLTREQRQMYAKLLREMRETKR